MTAGTLRPPFCQLSRLGFFDVFIKQQPHFRGITAENDELHALIMDHCSIRKHMSELDFGDCVAHDL